MMGGTPRGAKYTQTGAIVSTIWDCIVVMLLLRGIGWERESLKLYIKKNILDRTISLSFITCPSLIHNMPMLLSVWRYFDEGTTPPLPWLPCGFGSRGSGCGMVVVVALLGIVVGAEFREKVRGTAYPCGLRPLDGPLCLDPLHLLRNILR